jgi:Flp pilus assembly protein TadG
MKLRRPDAEQGGMTLELVLLTPIFVAFLMLLAGVGRTVDARSQIEGAARDAARAASVARTEGDAAAFADQAVREGLGGRSWCTGGPQVAMRAVPAWGAGNRVVVTVTCSVDLDDLGFIGLPATKTLRGNAVAPIDTYSYRGGDTG